MGRLGLKGRPSTRAFLSCGKLFVEALESIFDVGYGRPYVDVLCYARAEVHKDRQDQGGGERFLEGLPCIREELGESSHKRNGGSEGSGMPNGDAGRVNGEERGVIILKSEVGGQKWA